jgi:hypothetical protein
MEEAVAGTSAAAPVDGIKSMIDIGVVDNLINDVNPIGSAFNPRTPNTVEVPTYIICNPDKCPRDKSIKDMKNKEDTFDEGYNSDGKMGPFYNRTDKEGPQLFNEDDDDGVGFVAERAIDDERNVGIGTDTGVADDIVYHHVAIDSDTTNKMNFGPIKK